MADKIPYEEAIAGVPPKPAAKPGAISYEEAVSPQPAATHEGPLSNKAEDSTATKVAKNVGTALAKAGSNIVGGAGDLMSLGDAAYAGIMSSPRLFGADVPTYEQRLQRLGEKRAANELIPRPPTSADVREQALPITGEYVPETGIGRIGSQALEFGGTMLGPQAGVKVGEIGSRGAALLRDALTGMGAGAGGQMAVEALGENPATRLMGSLAGAVAPSIVQTGARAAKPMLMPESSARDVAGKVLRESSEDPEAVLRNLQRGPSAAARDLNVALNTGQIAEDRGVDALTEAVRAKNPEFKAATDAALDENLGRTAAAGSRLVPPTASGDAARALAERNVTDAAGDVAARIPNVPREEASVRAREFFDNAMQTAKTNVDGLWQQMRDSSGALFVNKTLSQIKDGFKGVDDVLERKRLVKLVDDYAEEWKNAGIGRDISPDMVNPLRSRLLEDARAAAQAGRSNEARTLGMAADSVLDAMSNRANWRFGDDSAVKLWTDARDASREFHRTFKDDALAPLSRSTSGGTERVAEGATLGRLTGGDPAQAAQNVRQFLQATGTGAVQDVTDFMYSKLTNNGTSKVTTGSIDKFLAKNGPVVDEVPGMRDQMNDLRRLAERHGALDSSIGNAMFNGRDPQAAAKYLLGQKDPVRAAQGVMEFGRMLGPDGKAYVDGVRSTVIDQMAADPTKLGDFMTKNASMLRHLFPDRSQLDTLLKMREVEKTLTRAPDRSFSNLKAFEDLTGGRVLDLLVGAAQGKLIGAGAGYLAGSAMAKAGVPDVGMAIELIGAALGSSASGGAGRIIYGSTAERAQQVLAEALKDPKAAASLLKRATPGEWTNMMKSFPNVALRASTEASSPD